MNLFVRLWVAIFGWQCERVLDYRAGSFDWADICGNRGRIRGVFPVVEKWNSKRPDRRRLVIRWHGMDHDLNSARYHLTGQLHFA